jgi:predicted RecA/RadA family phage recombinase
MTSYARYIEEGSTVDYTPTADVSAGQVVVQGNLIGVAKRPLPAGQLGSLAVEGVFDFPKATGAGSGIAAGTTAYWNVAASIATPDQATGGVENVLIGKVVGTGAADADTVVRIRMHQ